MDYKKRKEVFFSRWNWRHFMYEDFASIYAAYSSDPQEVGVIWQFDRSLSLMLLDYILLSEQLIKATFVQTVDRAFPDMDRDFKENGIASFVEKYPSIKNVDMGILLKAKRIADEKRVERIPFGMLVTYLSLNAMKNLLQQISKPLFLAFLKKLNEKRSDPLLPEEFMSTVSAMHMIRNIAAHNGQLLTKEVDIDFRVLTGEPLGSFARMLAKLLAMTGADKELLEEQAVLLESNKELNEQHRFWQGWQK